MAEKITLKNTLANLPQKTDVDSIVATDASGNPVYIKKADLAQVVAELIGTATTEKDGLLSKYLHQRIGKQVSGFKSIYKISTTSIYKKGIALISIYGVNANSLYAINFGNALGCKKLVGPFRKNQHLNFYKDDSCIYFKNLINTIEVNCIAASVNVTIEATDVDTSTLTEIDVE